MWCREPALVDTDGHRGPPRAVQQPFPASLASSTPPRPFDRVPLFSPVSKRRGDEYMAENNFSQAWACYTACLTTAASAPEKVRNSAQLIPITQVCRRPCPRPGSCGHDLYFLFQAQFLPDRGDTSPVSP